MGYARTGDQEKTVEYCSRLISLKRAALGWEPQQDWVSAHVVLTRTLIALGRNEEALRVLSIISTIWKNADPDLTLARQISALRSSLTKQGIGIQGPIARSIPPAIHDTLK